MFFTNGPVNELRSKTVSPNPYHEGDPNDRSLAFLESKYLIPDKVRNRASQKCTNELQEFRKCMDNSNLFMCISKNRILKACLKKWCKNEDLIKDCTEDYLNERARFRLQKMNDIKA